MNRWHCYSRGIKDGGAFSDTTQQQCKTVDEALELGMINMLVGIERLLTVRLGGRIW